MLRRLRSEALDVLWAVLGGGSFIAFWGLIAGAQLGLALVCVFIFFIAAHRFRPKQ